MSATGVVAGPGDPLHDGNAAEKTDMLNRTPSSDTTVPTRASDGHVLKKDEEDLAGTTSSDAGSHGEDEDDDEDDQEVDEHHGHAATRMSSNVSIAETLPLYRELLFVTVICLAQLFTQAGSGQAIAILHVIADDFGLGDSGDVSWIVAGYSLTVGTFILFSGRLGDLFGYKKMFLIGMAWFSVWSMICGLAVYSNHVLFIFARVLQGIGPALCLTNGLALLGATYAPGRRKAMVFAAFGATAPGGSILGAVFSGLFALKWWPWTFWTFSIVLAVVVVIGYYVIPPIPESQKKQHPPDLKGKLVQLDIPGTLTGVTGLVLFNFAWNQAPIVGWQQPYVYVTLILGILFIAAFFVIEIYWSTAPLLPFDALSTDVSFVLGAVACGWSCFGIWLWYTWQFFEESRGASPLLATAWFSPVAISGCIAAAFTGLMLNRLGPPVVMAMALCAFTAGTIIMATAPVDQTYWAQSFVSIILTPWGMDMSFPAATLILSNAVPRKHQGIGASLVNTVVNYSIALGLGFAGTVESQLNNGGLTPADQLKGYRAAFYMGIGLAGLGVLVSIAYLFKTHLNSRKKDSKDQEKA